MKLTQKVEMEVLVSQETEQSLSLLLKNAKKCFPNRRLSLDNILAGSLTLFHVYLEHHAFYLKDGDQFFQIELAVKSHNEACEPETNNTRKIKFHISPKEWNKIEDMLVQVRAIEGWENASIETIFQASIAFFRFYYDQQTSGKDVYVATDRGYMKLEYSP